MRKWLLQFSVLILVAAFVWQLAANASANLAKQGITAGFGFLNRPAGFDIIFKLIDFGEQSTYGDAFLVALCNTLLVSVVGIVLATALGFGLGIGQLAREPLVRGFCRGYIEIVRNVPLLITLFVWYFTVIRSLPHPRQSIALFDCIFLNNRGLMLPTFHWQTMSWDIPMLVGFNFRGGITVVPEFMALCLGLSTYTASYIGELVRAGIQSVPRGQKEAAMALGLSTSTGMRLVILPQALRLILPPLASQYLNLVKNSSLGAAIAYPELVLVFTGTVLNHTGQAVEVILITMLVYLGISLLIAGSVNWYNRHSGRYRGHA